MNDQCFGEHFFKWPSDEPEAEIGLNFRGNDLFSVYIFLINFSCFNTVLKYF